MISSAVRPVAEVVVQASIPVLPEVVSKHMACILLVKFQSSKHSITAIVTSTALPEQSFKTAGVLNLSLLIPES